jgi:hypothetical protein
LVRGLQKAGFWADLELWEGLVKVCRLGLEATKLDRQVVEKKIRRLNLGEGKRFWGGCSLDLERDIVSGRNRRRIA